MASWRDWFLQLLNKSDEPLSSDEVNIHSEAEREIIASASMTAVSSTVVSSPVVLSSNVETAPESDEVTAELNEETETPAIAEAPTKATTPTDIQGKNPRLTTILLTCAAAFICLLMIKEFSNFIGPVFFAWNLMIVAYPAYRWLRNKRVPSVIAATCAGVIIFAILIALIWGMVWSVIVMIEELPSYSGKLAEIYQQSIDWLTTMGISEELILEKLKTINPDNIINVLTTVLNSVSGTGGMIVVMVMAMFFIIMDTPGIKERMEMIQDDYPEFSWAMRDFNLGVRRYWVVTSLFGAIVAVLDWAALIALNVPLAGVWMIFSFLTNYIPNIGFVIGLIPPALLALVANGPVSMIIVIIVYWVLNFVAQGIIQPRYSGDAVGVTPTVSFLSLLLWGWALGGLGTLLALPCTLLAKALLIDCDPKARWVNAIIASEPETCKIDPLAKENET